LNSTTESQRKTIVFVPAIAGKEKYLKNQYLAERAETTEKDNVVFSGNAGNKNGFNSAISAGSSEAPYTGQAGERQKGMFFKGLIKE
jgi:hypothetical protein